MFVFEDNGTTTGPEKITSFEYFQKLVESFTQAIQARREGIFHVDLRLRPYGGAGSLAVSLEAFEKYFGPDGAAWPYERQALVKLRAICGDAEFGRKIEGLRDQLVYTGEPFDVRAMRAMREKQLRQLVKAGTFHAKLSPGGLVDVEYLVQGLQITYGKDNPALRVTNTRAAMRAMCDAGILSSTDYERLDEAYVFQRQLIDAMRMVRGNARDLALPAPESEELDYLARRLGYQREINTLKEDLERHTATVQELGRLLDNLHAGDRRRG
jgi:glutamate-ammonia-ligase adenylyltransferase